MSEDEVTTLQDAVKEVQEWLDEHLTADKDEFETKKKEFEGIVHPIFQKYQSAPGGPGAGAGGGEEEAEDMPGQDDL